jgi:hypothetical protein
MRHKRSEYSLIEALQALRRVASYGHSFSPDFYGDPNSPKESDQPTTVADALFSLSTDEWDDIASGVFGMHDGRELDISSVLDKIKETDSVSDLESPVEVWIDPQGYFTVEVYEDLSHLKQDMPKDKYVDNTLQ